MNSSGPASLTLGVVPVSAKTSWLFVSAYFADGTTGWGEVTDFGNETAIAADIRLIDKALRSGNSDALSAGRQGSHVRGLVLNGLEQAILDASARRVGVPLGRHLGASSDQAIAVYANINRGVADTRRPSDFAAQAKHAVAAGYRAIKLAPFDGLTWQKAATPNGWTLLQAGIQRVRAVREAVGSDIDVMVDCHSRFDPVSAIWMSDALAEARPFWIEDVLAPVFTTEDRRAFRRHAHRLGIRVAGGEELADMASLLAFLDDGGTDVVLPDLRLTGVRQGIAMCAAAAARGQLVSLHNPAGPVLDAVSRHVAAALSDFLILERPFAESPIFFEIAPSAAQPVEGNVQLDDAPGIGFAPAEAHLLAPELALETASRLHFRSMPGAGPDA